MSSQPESNNGKHVTDGKTVVQLTVAGFKSIREEQSIQIRPLTILAGANSAGKSSIMQPFLLLKQTLEANYDPGALLLNGPNVRFTRAKQLLSRTDEGKPVLSFRVGVGMQDGDSASVLFRNQRGAGFAIEEMLVVVEKKDLAFREEMSSKTIRELIPKHICQEAEGIAKLVNGKPNWKIRRERCFLNAIMAAGGPKEEIAVPVVPPPISSLGQWLRRLIHLPALRGNPQRTYPVTAVGRDFSGTFDNYLASVLTKWEGERGKRMLKGVCTDLQGLGLSWKVAAKVLNDAEVELRVGRIPSPARGGPRDLVSIADVGFGVSQALPVVVALYAGKKGSTVYIEQPEIHLHPRAQVALGAVLAKAVKRGVNVIVETHSQVLLLALRTAVASGELPTSLIKLHWFTRDEKHGTTTVQSADLDDSGAFGDWPEDFGQVELDIESSYLDAAERLSGKVNG